MISRQNFRTVTDMKSHISRPIIAVEITSHLNAIVILLTVVVT